VRLRDSLLMTTSQSSTCQPRRVLIVEDSDDARDALQLLLELDGHEVSVASDGPEALATALARAPDVALIDIGLPGFDGYELARRLRSTPQGSKMRLLALTGYSRPEDRTRVIEAGFDGHLVKPVDPDALTRTLGGS
jgi:CheY-like chemotaxis protein